MLSSQRWRQKEKEMEYYLLLSGDSTHTQKEKYKLVQIPNNHLCHSPNKKKETVISALAGW